MYIFWIIQNGDAICAIQLMIVWVFLFIFLFSKILILNIFIIKLVPDEFLFDPVTRTYGDPSKRPEINSSTIEFIAPPEYTVIIKLFLSIYFLFSK